MSKFEAFKLRMALLKIWFVKNLVVFFELIFIVSMILVLTGQLPESTPIVGELSIAIREVITQKYSDDFLVNLISMVLTLLVSVGMLSTNLKRIALSDIKSRNLKKALIQAGLYFNQDGKLVKRLEEATKMDISGDGKIGDSDIVVEDIEKGKLLPNLRRAGEELATIMTFKIETEEHAEQIKEKADLKQTEIALAKVAEAVSESVEKKITGDTAKAVESKIKKPGMAAVAVSKVKESVALLFVSIRESIKKSKEKSKARKEANRLKREAAKKASEEKKKAKQPAVVQQPVVEEVKTIDRKEALRRMIEAQRNKR
jgi:hypothetical protein